MPRNPSSGGIYCQNLGHESPLGLLEFLVQILPEQACALQAVLLLEEPAAPRDIPVHIQQEVSPEVWASRRPGRARFAEPVKIALKPGAPVVNQKQYPLGRKALEGITPLVQRCIEIGLLRPCRSPYNTPILPVLKPGTGEYRFVQDLRKMNQIVKDIHSPGSAQPIVPLSDNLEVFLGWQVSVESGYQGLESWQNLVARTGPPAI